MSIADFIAQKPNLSEIFKYVEQEAQRIAAERKKQAAGEDGTGIK